MVVAAYDGEMKRIDENLKWIRRLLCIYMRENEPGWKDRINKWKIQKCGNFVNEVYRIAAVQNMIEEY